MGNWGREKLSNQGHPVSLWNTVYLKRSQCPNYWIILHLCDIHMWFANIPRSTGDTVAIPFHHLVRKFGGHILMVQVTFCLSISAQSNGETLVTGSVRTLLLEGEGHWRWKTKKRNKRTSANLSPGARDQELLFLKGGYPVQEHKTKWKRQLQLRSRFCNSTDAGSRGNNYNNSFPQNLCFDFRVFIILFYYCIPLLLGCWFIFKF